MFPTLSLFSFYLNYYYYYYYYYYYILLVQHTFNGKQLRINNKKKVINNKLHHIISISLSHSNKNDSGTFSPSIKRTFK